MKLFFSQRLIKAPFDCTRWSNVAQTADLHFKGKGFFDRYEAIIVSGTQAVEWFNPATELLLAYTIYPPKRMHAKICTGNGRVHKGALIVQRIILGIVAFEAAVRVVDYFDSETPAHRKIGFTYATLAGHPECGIVTFTLNLNRQSQELSLIIESWSKPAHWILNALRPFTRFMQKQSNRQALENFKGLFFAATNPKDYK